MQANLKRKIINDPVYGFITVDHPLILRIISHPYYQRLRRISQMAFAQLVYPGAVHTRLHHSLGAYHLMSNAISELKSKGIEITAHEEVSAKAAILLHDIGHGPFSHALEKVLITGLHHEQISIALMHSMNREFEGQLDVAIQIFTNQHPKSFLHQLISGQLDVDRMDYLSRDSFFTGVSEGVIGYDRILKMLTVVNGQLVVEEKAIYSIEKFLVARRLMYWQVYLHKTVLSAELMLVRIIERAKDLILQGVDVRATTIPFDFFLQSNPGMLNIREHLDKFCMLDDYDVMATIKNWMHHPDFILSRLSTLLVERRLFKVKFSSDPVDDATLRDVRNQICNEVKVSSDDCRYFVFTGVASNTTYDPSDERINIVFKDQTVQDISQVDHALIQQTLASPVKKFYICFLKSAGETV